MVGGWVSLCIVCRNLSINKTFASAEFLRHSFPRLLIATEAPPRLELSLAIVVVHMVCESPNVRNVHMCVLQTCEHEWQI